MHPSTLRAAAMWLLALAAPAVEPAPADPIAALAHLDADAVYEAALAANPGLAARAAAARAAAARPRQAAALPDPVAAYQISPWTVGRGRGEPAQVATLSQAVPWPSTRSGRVDAARALAAAADADVDEARRLLRQEAREVVADYWLAARTVALQRRARDAMTRLQAGAEAAAATGGGPADALEARMAAAEAEHAALTAEREGAETAARIDELIGRDPRLPLPPPPDPLATVLPLPSLELLTHLAERRPAVAAARARERAHAADVARARGERLPEVSLMVGYTSMEHRHDEDVFAGISLSLPLDQGRRSAAVAEGAAALDEARAATRASELWAMREAVDAHVHLAALAKAIAVREEAIASARHAQAAAQAGLAAGAGSYADALRAERALLGAELALAQDLAEYSMHLGHLECCIGVPLESIAIPAGDQP